MGVSIVKRVGRTVLLGAWVGGIALAFGCGDGATSPIAPSPPAAEGGPPAVVRHDVRQPTVEHSDLVVGHDPPAAASPGGPGARNVGAGGHVLVAPVDGSAAGLKSTAAVPVAPIDDVVDDPMPTLSASNARSTYVDDAVFDYEFVLVKSIDGRETEIERGFGAPLGAGTTGYRISRALDVASTYVWRVRAGVRSEEIYDPWSEDARFRTVVVRLGSPRPLSPIDGAAVGIRPVFRVRNGMVVGDAGTVSIQLQVATDSGFTAVVARPEAPYSSGDETDVPAGRDLTPATYFWRARMASSVGPRGSWSAAATFRTAVSLGAPGPLSPIGNMRTNTLRPVFKVRTGAVGGGYSGTVHLELQVASDTGFTSIVGRARRAVPPSSEVDLPLQNELTRDTRYFWRVRAVIDSLEIMSDWSAAHSFRTPNPATTTPGRGTAPGRGQCCPPPNRFDIVQAVLRKTGNLYRNNIQEFTERVAECLAATDGDWGRRRNDSGRIGKDTVAYRTTKGPGRGPYSIDIMAGAESDNPRPHWYIQVHHGIKGRITGTWIAIDGGKCVL